ncbi:MAG: hypothetical protein ABFS45_22730 [Pseudomonadota bacterium]
MIPLALPDDAAGMHAYTPPAIVEQQESASTSSPADFIPIRTDLGSRTRASEEAESVDIAAFTTRKFVDLVDAIGELTREISKKVAITRQAKAAYRERIAELITDAAIDGITLNKASERDFWTFLKDLDFFWKGNLFLLDNGNIRAVWKSKTGDQIGVQFFGNGTVQYVIFKYRPRANSVFRVAGRDTIDGVWRQLAAFELDDLINP